MDNDDIVISFIVPAKNEKLHIKRCIDSIKKQFHPGLKHEIILVDNGSSDSTVEIAINEGAIVYIVPDVNISTLRNYGAKYANGEYLAFIDADVELKEKWAINALPIIGLNEVGIAGSSPQIPEESTWVEKTWHLQISCMPRRYDRDWLASMNMITKKKIFFEFNGFNESLNTCEDVDLGYRVSKKYRIVNDKGISAVHHGEAKTITELFKKEYWRGSSSFKGLFSHGIIKKEIVSILMPFATIIGFLIFTIGICWNDKALILLGLLFFSIFPITKSYIISKKCEKIVYSLPLLVIWTIYAIARSASAVGEIWKIIIERVCGTKIAVSFI